MVQPDVLSLLDHRILDGTELFLLRERRALPLLLRVVVIHFALQFPPLLVAPIHNRQVFHLVYDLIDLSLYPLWKIAIGLLALYLSKLLGKIQDHPLCFRMLTD